MLRRYLLVLLCLGTAVSCGPTDPARQEPAPSLRVRVQPLTTLTNAAVLTWGDATTSVAGCLQCGSPVNTYQCPGSATHAAWSKEIVVAPALLAGRRVVGLTARVYGTSVDGSPRSSSANVKFYLNSKTSAYQVGMLSTTERMCSASANKCEPTSTNGGSSITLANNLGGIGWNETGTNRLEIVPDRGSYCISHVALDLVVAERHIAVSPNPLPSFGKRQVGNQSQVQPLTVTNDGQVPLTISGISATGDFRVVSPVLLPGETRTVNPTGASSNTSLTIQVAFLPTTTGVRDGELNITSNARDPQPPIELVGEGVAYAMDVAVSSPDSGNIDFQDQRAGYTAERTVTLRNVGLSTINVVADVPSGVPTRFSLKNAADAAFELMPGDPPKVVTVRFDAPTDTEETVHGELTFSAADDLDGDGTANPGETILLQGRSTKPVVALNPAATLTFPNQRAGTQVSKPLVVTNTGSRALNLTAIQETGTGYRITNKPTLPYELAAKVGNVPGTLTLQVEFDAPLDNEATILGRVDFTSDDPTSVAGNFHSFGVDLRGNATKPNLVLTPATTLDFGDRRAGKRFTQVVKVRNEGSHPIEIKQVNREGNAAFSIVSVPPVPITLGSKTGDVAPEFSVEVEFFAPLTTGIVSGFLAFESEDPGNTRFGVSLSGKSVKPIIDPITTVAFGETPVNTDHIKPVVIHNSGTGPITFSSVFISAGSGSFSLHPPRDPSTPLLVGPGDTTLEVKFRPTIDSATTIAGQLRLISVDEEIPNVTVGLSGTGINPILSKDKSFLEFNEHNVGAPGAVLPLSLHNTGSGTLLITGVSVDGGPFSVSPSSSLPIALSGTTSATLSVTFAPSQTGNFSQNLTITTTDPNNKTVIIPLSGKSRRLLTVTPDTLNFGPVPKDGATGELEFTVSNTGSKTISVQSLLFSAPSLFSTTTPLPISLGPSQREARIKVVFNPSTNLTVNETLTVISRNEEDSSAGDNSPQISLVGKGSEPKIKLSIVGQSADNQQTVQFDDTDVKEVRTKTIEVENTGDATLTVTQISIETLTPPGSDPFRYSSQIYEIPPSQKASFVVTFAPTQSGAARASLSVISNASNGSPQLELAGVGRSAHMAYSRNVFNFGSVKLNAPSTAENLIIRNTGKAKLRLTQITTTSSAFSIATTAGHTFPLEIDADGGEETFALTFTPSARGLTAGELRIFSNADNADQLATVTLQGMGLDGVGLVTPPEASVINFGVVNVNTRSTRQTIRIENSGDYLLRVQEAKVETTSEPNPFKIEGFKATDIQTGAGKFYEFYVVFAPEYRDAQHRGTLIIHTDSVTNPVHNLSMTGEAQGPGAEIETPSINFEKVNVQAYSDPLTLSVHNNGETTLRITGVDFTAKPVDGGTPSTDDMSLIFSVGRTADGRSFLPVNVDAGTSMEIPLRFKPNAEGLRVANATVRSTAKPVVAEVRGEGTLPRLKVTPKELSFLGVVVGTSSLAQSIEILNEGTGPVVISGVHLGSDQTSVFDVKTSQPLPATLEAKVGKMNVQVKFVPSLTQTSAEDQLIITPEGTLVSQEVVRLSGDGIILPVTVDPEVAFGKRLINNQAKAVVSISNGLTESVTLKRATLEAGTGCTPFKVGLASGATVTIPSFATHQLEVSFNPLSVGESTCKLSLELTHMKDKSTVNLTGEGIRTVLVVKKAGDTTGTDAGVTPTLDFGTLRAGSEKRTERFSITNVSNDTVMLDRPVLRNVIGEPFAIALDDLDKVELASNEPRFVTVDYQPQQPTLSEATLVVGTLKPVLPGAAELFLKGKSTETILEVTGANSKALDFGLVEVSAASAAQTLSIRNKSTQSQRVIVSVSGSASDSFVVDASQLGDGTIGPGAGADFTVTFRPNEVGEATGEILIKLQDDARPEVTIPAKGVGRILTGRGMGCVSGGAEAGSASVLALLALLGLRSHRRRRV